MTPKISPYDLRYAQRELSRMQGLDPGSGASLEDYTTDETAATPTLQAMTTTAFEHPPIAPVGTAPRGRERSGEGSADEADRRSRAKADFALEADRRARSQGSAPRS